MNMITFDQLLEDTKFVTKEKGRGKGFQTECCFREHKHKYIVFFTTFWVGA